MKSAAVAGLAVLLSLVSAANAQIADATSFGSKNTYSAFIEYANDSSHIVLGRSANRRFVSLGVQYEHRLISNRNFVLRYAAEFRPLIFVSDPTLILTLTETSPPPTQTFVVAPLAVTQCTPETRTISSTSPTTGIVFTETLQTTCSRRWTYAQGLSPLGTRINLLPHHRLQPTGSLLVGYMLSANRIPVDTAGSFNFTFEVGAGLEYFLSQNRSMRFEYQIQHFSNAYTADTNPGVDSGLFKLTYNFGR
jgi:Lipid A 3-O-deacylase (PagL)